VQLTVHASCHTAAHCVTLRCSPDNPPHVPHHTAGANTCANAALACTLPSAIASALYRPGSSSPACSVSTAYPSQALCIPTPCSQTQTQRQTSRCHPPQDSNGSSACCHPYGVWTKPQADHTIKKS
jgi:hypothetical protein